MRELIESEFWEAAPPSWNRWCYKARWDNGDFRYSTGHKNLIAAKENLAEQCNKPNFSSSYHINK